MSIPLPVLSPTRGSKFLGMRFSRPSPPIYCTADFPWPAKVELTDLRASLVRASTLAAFARDLQLGPCLRLGRGEEATGGRSRDLLLARAMEAVIGAVYLDGGMRASRNFLEPHLIAELDLVTSRRHLKDDKSLLQEVAQAQLGITPTYRLAGDRAARLTSALLA